MNQKYHHPSPRLRRPLITAVTLIVLALLCTVPAAAAEPVPFSGGEYSSAQELASKLGDAATASGNTLTLKKDIKLTGQLAITNGTITIIGNDHTIWTGTDTANLIQLYNGGKLTLGDGTSKLTFDGKNIKKTKGVLFHIGSPDSALVMQNHVTIQNIVAPSYGSAVYIDGTGSFTMKGGEITNCTAGYTGGAIYVEDGSFIMEDGIISRCQAKPNPHDLSRGGGISTDGRFNTSILMKGGKITGNIAHLSGGGIYANSNCTFTMSGGEISGNTANDGGGIYIFDDLFTMTGGTISGNNAANDGGGVYNYAGTFSLSGGSISGNTATSPNSDGNGGGVVNFDGPFTMTGGTISGNNAVTYGGGVCNFGTFSLLGGNITGNKVTTRSDRLYDGGGGVYNWETFTMSGGTISGNTVPSVDGDGGGGVYNMKTFTMTGGTISGNTVAASGGGIYNKHTFTMTGGIISGNKATGTGAELYHTGSEFSLSGSGNISGGTTYLDGTRTITLSGALSGTGGIQNIVTPDPKLNDIIVTTRSSEDAKTARPYFTLDSSLAKDYGLIVSGTNIVLGEYTVTYHGTGSTAGTAPTDSNTYKPNVQVTVKDQSTLVKTGHTFDGWNTKADGSGTAYNAGAAFPINEDTTLYAQWKPNVTTITLQNNSKTFDTVTITYGTDKVHDTPKVPTKPTHTLLGWYTAETGGLPVINSVGDLINSAGYVTDGTWIYEDPTLTLYAQWHKSTLPPKITTTGLPEGITDTKYEEVTLKATGTTPITWSIASGNLPNGLTLSPDGIISGTPTKAGTFTFTVQAANADPAGTDTKQLTITIASNPNPGPKPPQPTQPPATSGSSSGNMDNAFRVLFETSGGSFISPATSLSYGDKISQPPAPTKDGCTFGGWYKDEACTLAWSFSEGIPGDITLYAKWNHGSSTDPTPTAPETAEPTTAPETHHPTAIATTAPPVTATSKTLQPTLTQAPAPIAGALLGLLAAGTLIR
nr:InlB B-repeat-containing protein [Methanocorpusculum sp.]